MLKKLLIEKCSDDYLDENCFRLIFVECEETGPYQIYDIIEGTRKQVIRYASHFNEDGIELHDDCLAKFKDFGRTKKFSSIVSKYVDFLETKVN